MYSIHIIELLLIMFVCICKVNCSIQCYSCHRGNLAQHVLDIFHSQSDQIHGHENPHCEHPQNDLIETVNCTKQVHSEMGDLKPLCLTLYVKDSIVRSCSVYHPKALLSYAQLYMNLNGTESTAELTTCDPETEGAYCNNKGRAGSVLGGLIVAVVVLSAILILIVVLLAIIRWRRNVYLTSNIPLK